MSQYSSYDSTELLKRAQTIIPGGVNSPVRAFKGVSGSPLFFKQGEGPYLIDVEGNRYIDYVCSWGPLILGHAHPKVLEALAQTSRLGLTFGAPTPLEIEIAELITQSFASIEQVRLVCSGTEATQSAIRLARGYTHRNKILKFEGCYHGHVDSLLVKAGSGLLTLALPDSAGVPESFTQHTLTAPFNDLESVAQIFAKFGDDIAAIIVEPVAGNMNCVLPEDNFLPGLRKICDQYGALLIFDEVITGFRVALNGAQGFYSVKPDLTCLGKIIGGGLPVGAFGGRRDIMEHLAPVGPVYQAGTLAGNPLAIAAGLATIEVLQSPNVFNNIVQATQRLTESLSQCAQQYSIPLKIHHIGGMFGLLFTEEDNIRSYTEVATCNQNHFRHFFHAMLKEGIYLAPSAFECGFMSAAHADYIIGETLEAAKKVFQTWPKIQNP